MSQMRLGFAEPWRRVRGDTVGRGGEPIEKHDERRLWLKRQLAAPVSLVWTENRAVMISISVKGNAAGYQLRVQKLFREAPENVWQALVAHVRDRDSGASAILRQYVRQHQHLLDPQRRRPARALALQPQGQCFDLEAIYQGLNRDYFSEQVKAHITWGRRAPRRRRRSIRFGAYDSRKRLIRIHPLLDQAFVPLYVVENVVFHEMLHQLNPPQRVNGRWSIHPPAFRREERRYTHFERAESWQQKHLARLLRG